MLVQVDTAKIEKTLSAVQAKLADIQESLLQVSSEVEELYISLGVEIPKNDIKRI